jgi:hypothetical protein
LTELLDLADVGFSLVGVRRHGEHHGVRRGGVEDQSSRLGLGVGVG